MALDVDDAESESMWDDAAARRPGNDPTSVRSKISGRKLVGAKLSAQEQETPPAEGNGIPVGEVRALLAAIADAKPSKKDDPLDLGLGPFKMKGTEGRIRWQQLNDEFESNPKRTWQIFEQRICRTMKKQSFNDVSLERFCKHHVPMGDHKTATRYLMGLTEVYEHLSAGRTDHARAQVALLIGATQFMVVEDSWDPAWHITGLGSPGFHEFRKAPKRDKNATSTEDEIAGSCVDPRRALTARQIKTDHKAALSE